MVSEDIATQASQEQTPDPPRPDFLIGISRAILLRIFLIALALALVFYASEVVLIAFAGILLAIILRGLSDELEKLPFISPRWSYASLLCILTVIIAVLGYMFGPRVVTEAREVVGLIPQSAAHLRQTLDQYEAGRDVTRLVDDSMQSKQLTSQATNLATTTVQGLLDAFVILVTGIFLGNKPEMYRNGVLYFVPKPQRAKTAAMVNDTAFVVRRWLLAQLIPMAVLGVGSVVGLRLLDIPLAFALGLFTSFMLFVPYAGSVIAFIPTALVAFTVSPVAMVHVAILYVCIHLAEGYVISPLAQRRVVHLPPALTLLAQLFMWKFAGVLGVVVATPLAAVALVTVQKLRQHNESSRPANV